MGCSTCGGARRTTSATTTRYVVTIPDASAPGGKRREVVNDRPSAVGLATQHPGATWEREQVTPS